MKVDEERAIGAIFTGTAWVMKWAKKRVIKRGIKWAMYAKM